MMKNPFHEKRHLSHRACSRWDGERAVSLDGQNAPGAFAQEVHQDLRKWILDEDHSCVGAKSAFFNSSYFVGTYQELGTANAAAGMSHDLWEFLHMRKELQPFATYMAVFQQPEQVNEEAFEQLLWKQLELLHQESSRQFEWDREVSSDPGSAKFSYSFGGKGFYVVGMHPGSSRDSRRFRWPMLVFNLHEQFQQLRESGTYDSMKETIRSREQERYGSLNPMLQDFGAGSEAKQYSGRKVDEAWKCPVHFDGRGTKHEER